MRIVFHPSHIIYNPATNSKEPLLRKLPLLAILAASFALTSCGSSDSGASAAAVESYLNALVAKDAERLPTLVCGDWEEDALIELDSLQAVSARLEGVSCTQTGSDGATALVDCTGSIVLTYDTEDQNIELSNVTYQVVEEGGEWLVCGKR